MSATAEMDFENQLAELTPNDGEAEARYRDLLVRIVGKEGWTKAEITETLDASGRKATDLASNARRLRQRKEAIEALGADPVNALPDFSARDKALDDEAKAAEDAYRDAMLSIERRRGQIDTRRQEANAAARQSRSAAERIVHGTTPPAIHEELQRLHGKLDEAQVHRLRIEAKAWNAGAAADLRDKLDAEQERLSALTDARGDDADGVAALRGTVNRLKEKLGTITAAQQEAAAMIEQEQAIVERHNALAAKAYDWQTFTLDN